MTREEIYNNTKVNVYYVKRNWFTNLILGNIVMEMKLNLGDGEVISQNIRIKCDYSYQLDKKIYKVLYHFINRMYNMYNLKPENKMKYRISQINEEYSKKTYHSFNICATRFIY